MFSLSDCNVLRMLSLKKFLSKTLRISISTSHPFSLRFSGASCCVNIINNLGIICVLKVMYSIFLLKNGIFFIPKSCSLCTPHSSDFRIKGK